MRILPGWGCGEDWMNGCRQMAEQVLPGELAEHVTWAGADKEPPLPGPSPPCSSPSLFSHWAPLSISPSSASLLLLSARPSVSGFSPCIHHVQFCICKVGSPGTTFRVWNPHLFYLLRAQKRSCRSPRGTVKWEFQFTPAVWSWTSYLLSLSLSFPSGKMDWWHLSHRFAVRSKVDHLSAGAWHVTDSPFSILPRALMPALQNTQCFKYSWSFISLDSTSSESTNWGSKYSGKKKNLESTKIKTWNCPELATRYIALILYLQLFIWYLQMRKEKI